MLKAKIEIQNIVIPILDIFKIVLFSTITCILKKKK
jgi:hypothetical protein